MKTDLNPYKKLKEDASNKELDIKFLIAPPRSGSTVLEKIIASSPSNPTKIHEPFINFGYRDQKKSTGYMQILEERESDNLVVKDMSHWLSKENAYEEIFELTYKPIIYNVRNPLLTAESRIKVVLKSYAMKARDNTIEWLKDYAAKELEVNNWSEVSSLNKSYILKDSLDKESTQNNLFNFYAQTKGSKNWDRLMQDSINKQDYTKFNDLLQCDEKRFSLEGFGWEAIDEQLDYLRNNDKDYFIIDNTDFRNKPAEATESICQLWDLKFSERMLTWDKPEADKNQNRKHDQIWYQSLNESNSVKKPTESVPSINAFPGFVKEYLREVAIPIYKNIVENKPIETKKVYSVVN